MTTQYTPILKLALPVEGELDGTWGDVVNDSITNMVEEAIAGAATISTWTANVHTLTTVNGASSTSRCAMLIANTGTGGTAITAAGQIICPAATKIYILKNNTAYAVTLKTSAGSGVAVAAGEAALLFCDGTNVQSGVTTMVNGNITGNLTVGGNATITGSATVGGVAVVTTSATQTLTNKTLTAPVISTIVNSGTLTLPTSTDTMVGRATTDTLTNKTLTAPVISTIVNGGTLTLPTSTDTMVGRATTDTLTNKTLTAPVISTIVNGGTLTLPTSTDTMVGRATTDTLTNKTISGANNTLSNIGNASLTNSSVTVNGTAISLGGSGTVSANTTNALTVSTGLALNSGTTFDGSAARTISIDSTVTTLTGSQTLTNKTFTNPVLSSAASGTTAGMLGYLSGALSYGTGTVQRTVVNTDEAQTLTNKTINASSNTLTNIPNSALVSNNVTFNGVAVSLGGSGTITAANPNAITISTGLALNTGSTYDGSAARTLTIDSTVATLTGTQTLTNKTINAASNTLSNIPNAALTNSSVTVNGVNIALGGSGTISATISNALTIGTGLSGTSYNGSSPVTIAIDSTVATLAGAQTLTNKTISGSNNTLSNIGNASLTNSSITLGTSSVSLGGTLTTPTGLTISGATNTLSNIGNASLTNSAVTFNGVSVSLGGTGTITAQTPSALTIGTGLTGGSFNGGSAVTIAIDSSVVTTSGTQTLTNKTINGANNTISNVPSSALPSATTTAVGAVELATDAETQTGTDTTRAITPSNLAAAKLQLGTAVASTSGTSIDFGPTTPTIPSWVKRITVMFDGVSTNGASSVLVQLGDSGGVETTGYAAAVSISQQSQLGVLSAFTNGFCVAPTAGGWNGGLILQGMLVITKLTGDSWVAMGVTYSSATSPANQNYHISGSKTLSATLDRVRITTANGTDTFDAGTINIMWE